MAIGYNPKVVTSGLKFHIDAANIKSYDANDQGISGEQLFTTTGTTTWSVTTGVTEVSAVVVGGGGGGAASDYNCLLYTSPSPRDVEESRMPSSA